MTWQRHAALGMVLLIVTLAVPHGFAGFGTGAATAQQSETIVDAATTRTFITDIAVSPAAGERCSVDTNDLMCIFPSEKGTTYKHGACEIDVSLRKKWDVFGVTGYNENNLLQCQRDCLTLYPRSCAEPYVEFTAKVSDGVITITASTNPNLPRNRYTLLIYRSDYNLVPGSRPAEYTPVATCSSATSKDNTCTSIRAIKGTDEILMWASLKVELNDEPRGTITIKTAGQPFRPSAVATTCGDGRIDAGEQCDQSNLNSKTCVTQGFTSGTLRCTGSCMLDTAGCTRVATGGTAGTATKAVFIETPADNTNIAPSNFQVTISVATPQAGRMCHLFIHNTADGASVPTEAAAWSCASGFVTKTVTIGRGTSEYCNPARTTVCYVSLVDGVTGAEFDTKIYRFSDTTASTAPDLGVSILPSVLNPQQAFTAMLLGVPQDITRLEIQFLDAENVPSRAAFSIIPYAGCPPACGVRVNAGLPSGTYRVGVTGYHGGIRAFSDVFGEWFTVGSGVASSAVSTGVGAFSVTACESCVADSSNIYCIWPQASTTQPFSGQCVRAGQDAVCYTHGRTAASIVRTASECAGRIPACQELCTAGSTNIGSIYSGRLVVGKGVCAVTRPQLDLFGLDYLSGGIQGNRATLAGTPTPIYGASDCVGLETCWCQQIVLESSTFRQEPQYTDAKLKPQAEPWVNPKILENPPTALGENGAPKPVCTPAATSALTIEAKLVPALAEAGELVTVSGDIASRSATCQAYNYTCERATVLPCTVDAGRWSIAYDYPACPENFPIILNETGKDESSKRLWGSVLKDGLKLIQVAGTVVAAVTSGGSGGFIAKEIFRAIASAAVSSVTSQCPDPLTSSQASLYLAGVSQNPADRLARERAKTLAETRSQADALRKTVQTLDQAHTAAQAEYDTLKKAADAARDTVEAAAAATKADDARTALDTAASAAERARQQAVDAGEAFTAASEAAQKTVSDVSQAAGDIADVAGFLAAFACYANPKIENPTCYRVCGKDYARVDARPVCTGGGGVIAATPTTTACGRPASCGPLDAEDVRLDVYDATGAVTATYTTRTDAKGIFNHTFTAPQRTGDFSLVISVPSRAATNTVTGQVVREPFDDGFAVQPLQGGVV